jgi:hypothetical protein
MTKQFARLIEVDGQQVLLYADSVEDSEGETVWAIITQFITENQSVAKLQTSYHVETTLDQVLEHLFNVENDPLVIKSIQSIMKTFGEF